MVARRSITMEEVSHYLDTKYTGWRIPMILKTEKKHKNVEIQQSKQRTLTKTWNNNTIKTIRNKREENEIINYSLDSYSSSCTKKREKKNENKNRNEKLLCSVVVPCILCCVCISNFDIHVAGYWLYNVVVVFV